MYRVEQYLNAGQREAFRRKVAKVEQKRKKASISITPKFIDYLRRFL